MIKTIDSSVYSGTNKNLLCIVDFNNDDNKDLAIAESKLENSVFSCWVTVMSANGHDTLLNPVDFSIPNFLCGLLARDVNGDDQIDLAVISSETADSNQRTILHNGNIPASLENQQVGKTSCYVDPDFFKDQERISG